MNILFPGAYAFSAYCGIKFFHEALVGLYSFECIMRLKAYVWFPFWCLGLVSLASNSTTEHMSEARQLVAEVQQKIRSPASASNRLVVLKNQQAASVLLLEMLRKPMDVPTQHRLVELLALLSEPISANYFLNSLESEDAYLRMLSATTLGQLRVQAALPKLVLMLEDERLALRREAAMALGRLKQKQAGKPLLVALQAEAEPEVRERMLWALGMLNDKKNLSSMQVFLTHSSETTRWAAAKALLAMGELSGWKWLKPHLNSKEDKVCAYALLSLEEAVPGKNWKAEALALLHQTIRERETSLAISAAVLAARWGDKAAYVWLEKKAEQSENMELRAYEEALDKVRHSLANTPTPKEKPF